MRITLKVESNDNCPSKNKEIVWESSQGNYFTIQSRCYIENHITLPIDLIKTMLKLVEERNKD